MGGAFVGDASDLSAAYWNPAGLTQLENSQFAIGVGGVWPTGTYTFSEYGVDASMAAKLYPSGVLGYAHGGGSWTAGVFASVPSGAGASWDPDGLLPLSLGQPMNWESQIGVAVISPAAALEVTERLSLGVAVNVNVGMLKFNSPVVVPEARLVGQYEESDTGWGVGAGAGLRYAASERLALGVAWRAPVTVEFSGDATNPLAPIIGQGAGMILPETSGATRSIRWPMWLGAGVSFRPATRWVFNADVHYTKWGDLEQLAIGYDDPLWQQLFADGGGFGLNCEDRFQFRLGMAHELTETLSLRLGYYYDPTPTPVESLNILLPAADFHGLTAGIGWQRGSIDLDVGLELLVSGARTSPPTSAMPGEHHYKTVLIPQIVLTHHSGR
jgi:long-chain fatty acid transport protein